MKCPHCKRTIEAPVVVSPLADEQDVMEKLEDTLRRLSRWYTEDSEVGEITRHILGVITADAAEVPTGN